MTDNSKTISFIQFQLPVIAWVLFIFIASSIPSKNITLFGGYSDKFVHAGVFAVLCWLAHVALLHQPNASIRIYSLIIAVCFTSLFGVSDEYHQMFTPGRSVDVYDWLADTTGALIYAGVMLRFKFYRNE